MKTISQLFSELYDKVLIHYQNKYEEQVTLQELTANDEHYLDILYTLENPTLTTFAEKATISKPAATRIIHRFVEKGYLTREMSSSDRRTYYLKLNDEIKAYCKRNYELFDEVFDECISVLTKEEQKNLYEMIRKVNQQMDLNRSDPQKN